MFLMPVYAEFINDDATNSLHLKIFLLSFYTQINSMSHAHLDIRSHAIASERQY